ncbi:MAG: transcription termination/antitermination protein NusG [Thermotogota bacterium]|nr:transcription termination/antitermination protein NusG [Thermotogota bacterium]MDK2865496.1 transcription termination/antitermination protein NusG [Thermotogota bacterium]HCZ05797.1 transcription termination/antitermination factor NusG [Thermotogota bacterium]
MRKEWYVVQTYAGLETKVKESLERKFESLGYERYIGRIVVPEETIIDSKSKSVERHVVPLSAKLHVSTGSEVEAGQLLAEEPNIHARRNGVITEIKNFKRIIIETIDHKYTKIYNIPESHKPDSSLKVGVRIRQGMPLAKKGEYFSEIDGKIVSVERLKRVVVQTEDGETDTYYIPYENFDSSKIQKGMTVKAGMLIGEGKKYYSRSKGKVEVLDLGTRREIRIAKTKTRRLFPGYVFVELLLTNEIEQLIRMTPNVINFVSAGGQPIPLKRREIKALLRLIGEEEYEEKKAATVEFDFTPGEAVKIISGPFEGFVGVVQEVNPEHNEVKVMVTIFGRETPVVLHTGEVEKLT